MNEPAENRPARSQLNGWIILDKPSGITSAHAVAKVKRLLRPSKIGHAGTLDPLASGILPLALGEATKAVPYLMDSSKTYAFTASWGEERDTDDSEGEVTARSDSRPSREEVQALLRGFTGQIEQMPPSYSAILVDGKRAYELARGGNAPQLKARPVTVKSLEITQHNDNNTETTFLCHCGKGTYIRSLARDMGRALGCYGHITALRRLRVGRFDQTHAISLESLAEMRHNSGLGHLQPVQFALDDIPVLDCSDDQASRLRHGQPITPQGAPAGLLWARNRDTLVAVCDWKDGELWPSRVFNLL